MFYKAPAAFPKPNVSAQGSPSGQRLKGKRNGLPYRLRMSWNIALVPYGSRWRTWRKVFHEYFHSNASLQYRPRELKAARHLLENILRTPEDYRHHIRLSVASLSSIVDY
jgi:hypothetical protein